MPRDGAIIFSDLVGKLDLLRSLVRNVTPPRVPMRPFTRYLPSNMNDPCGAKCPDLPRVL
jgi:hypothetical protein